MHKVCVILPAAGSGKRFGPDGDKARQPLLGRPVFLRTLELFCSRADVCQVLLVLPPDRIHKYLRDFGDELSMLKVEIIAGGSTRTASVRNALERASAQADLIAVHDAVRPLVTDSQIDAVFAQASECGAAILAWPVHATLKRAAGRVITETVPRDDVWEAQTPQVFRRDWLLAAYAGGGQATDDAALVQAVGHAVQVVPAAATNIKITTPDDMKLAEAILQSRQS
jgi:2-C-methyl-D-erythritol 4-phosphate cytidylyltransferase